MVTVQEIVDGAFDPGEALRLLAVVCNRLVNYTESLEKRVAALEARPAAAAEPSAQPAKGMGGKARGG